MSDLQAQLENLSPAQRKLLELMLQQKAAQTAAQPAAPAPEPADSGAIPRRADSGPAPLSFGQQRLWLLDQFQPGSAFYNMNLAMELEGSLDIVALEASLNEIVRRHSVLRTTFRAGADGEPAQVVAPELRLALRHEDLGHLPPAERAAEAQRRINRESEQPFDLADGPLLRGLLVRHDAQLHTFILVLHHIICDGWSTGVILRELVALYPAMAARRPAPLPELPIQYADYAAWQRRRLQGPLLTRQLAYWTEQLGGKVGGLELPTDLPRAAAQGFSARGVKLTVQIGRPLTDALLALSKAEGATLFMTLLAGFQTLLARYTGQPHILVGSPIANRNQAEIEGMIGFFNNVLVLDGDLSDAPSFRALLRQVREVTLRAYDHQELPFERLVEEFQPRQSISRSPLFQVMFALQNTPRPTLKQGGLTLRPLVVDNGTARFDLTLSLRETEQGLFGSLLYNADLFDAATVERLLGHYETLLAGAVAAPDQPVTLLPLLTPAERAQILAWSETGRIYLLDRHQQPVPIGVYGDVYVSDDEAAGEQDVAAAPRGPHPLSPSPAQRERGDAAPAPPTLQPSAPSPQLRPTGQRARFRADGTLDIRAPDAASGDGAAAGRPFVAPRTPVEAQLAAIWADILGQARIGVHDDFFALGGHSLSAARLLTRVRDAFQVDLPLRRLFEATSVAQMAELIAGDDLALAAPPAILPRAPGGVPPLSFAQERVWFLDQLDPGSPAFNIPFAVRLRGPLDRAAFQRSLDTIVARHESLRTTFPAIDGSPVQLVADPAPVPIALIDLGHLPPEAHPAEVRRLIMAGAQHHFDLAGGPLLRAELLRLSEREHVFLLTIHHIVFDAWSVGLFLRELTVLYDAFARGEPSPLPALAVQYADFAIWQREWLQGAVLEQQLSYWKRQLGGALPVLELPGDYPRPPAMSYQGAIYTHQLPADLSERLVALGQAEGATLFMTLFAAFQTLLYRYTGEEDIIIGSLIANRDSVAIEGLLGYFINTLLLRADSSGNPTFRALLRRVREMMLEAYAHQTVPFEQLVEVLRPPRDPSHTPLFQVMLILQNAPIPTRAQHDLEVEFLRIDNKTSKFDLTLSFTELPEGLRAVAEYNTDIFEEATIVRMLGHLQTMLESLAADPDRRLADLDLLDLAERRRLTRWPQAPAPAADDRCIHQLFEEQAARTPDAPALICADTQLSYAELNRRANQLAHQLRAMGVGPEARVGLCIERSCELLVGILGVLKAGGAYVPLDPAYPRERLAFMIDDSRIGLLLTAADDRLPDAAQRRQLLEGVRAAAGPGCAALDLRADWPQIARRPEVNLGGGAGPEQLAYVIYTSGSVGRPKGVLVGHRSLVNYTEAARAAYGITPADRVLQFASINFDASAEEIYTALTGGAALVLRDERMVETIAAFVETCAAWRISVLSLPTAFWHELVVRLAADGLRLPATLRLLIIGGERALPERVALWQQHVGAQVRLINTYGPTEATVVATAYPVPPEPQPGRRREVPIGRPLVNLRAYVLDRGLRPVPVGVPGELCVGGAGLARGYLNQPALTAERFLPDPFAPPAAAGARLYRTGDLVRLLPDGEIEYLGRVDHQVKIRGFRVELGEIEAALRRHPAVADAAVIAREDSPGDKRLVAYLTPHAPGLPPAALADASRPSELPGASELRAFLKEHLPVYMLPAAFVSLERLPLTTSGKINLRALPAPDTSRSELEHGFVAPRTPTETQVAELWAGVLRLERVSVHDNFFELGGHSLLATQMIARLRSAFQVDLPLRHLFGAPTVAGIAAVIETIRWMAQGVDGAPDQADDTVEEGEL